MNMRTMLCALSLGLAMISANVLAQDAHAFHRGEAFPAPRAQPAAWLMELHKADALLGSNIAVAEFLPNTIRVGRSSSLRMGSVTTRRRDRRGR